MSSDSVVVAVIPPCDIHALELGVSDEPAAYDAKTSRGPWAYMCAPCYRERGVGLGLGLGQRLVLRGSTTPLR